MKKDEEEKTQRGSFAEKEVDALKEYHKDEIKEEHQAWKEDARHQQELEKEHVKEFSRQQMKEEGGVQHKQKRDKMLGGVRGKPHPEKKMDRKGRTEKS